jgi:predicted DNA-binding transcriptional regulator AlpA
MHVMRGCREPSSQHVVRVADAIPGAAAANLPELAVFEVWHEGPNSRVPYQDLYKLEALASIVLKTLWRLPDAGALPSNVAGGGKSKRWVSSP